MISVHSLATWLCLAFLLPYGVYGQSPQAPQTAQATLSIFCDADCSWNVDGDQHGALKKGEEARVNVLFGAHSIEATSLLDGKHWERTVVISQPNLEKIRISFAPGSKSAEADQDAPEPVEKSIQSEESTGGIPRFYSQSRQVLVEAEVWSKRHDKTKPSRTGNEPLGSIEKQGIAYLPPPARGLTAKDFHIFDNGAEQAINYLQEADFPAVDTTHQWRFVATTHGTWGDPSTFDSAMEFPSATYLIGYVPPPSRPGECHTIKVLVQQHEVQVNRDQYCIPSNSGSANNQTDQEAKLRRRMLHLAASSAHGMLDVSMQAFTFWSSGVLSLVKEPFRSGDSTLPLSADFTYVVDVHDSKAPATVQIAAEFDLPTKRWDYPCRRNDAIHVLITASRQGGEVAGQVDDVFRCSSQVDYAAKAFLAGYYRGFIVAPSRFDSQLTLPPGDYELALVVSDGDNFGKAQIPLRVEPFNPQELITSDVVVGGVLRDAAWVLREAASVSPSPVLPSPLISKNIQFFPDSEAPPRLRRHMPLFLYFEIYRPLPELQSSAVYYQLRVTNQKTGTMVMDTGPMSASSWVVPGNAVVPIGLKLNTEKLDKGSYRLELQAVDSAGQKSVWRRAMFVIN